jgi:hypothetical protein
VWPLEAIEDVILECAREGAAISQGQVLMATEQGLAPLPWQPGVKRHDGYALDDVGPSSWICERGETEQWDAYVARSTEHAITTVRSLSGKARYSAEQSLYVDIAWVTCDEPVLFDLPGYERAGLERAITTGERWLPRRHSTRVALAGAAPGSFHGGPSYDVASIPADARFAWAFMAAKGIRRLPSLERLEVLWTDSPTQHTERYLGDLPWLRVLELDIIRPKCNVPLDRLESLEVLSVGPWRQSDDLRVLASLAKLRVLRVCELRLPTLDSLAELTQLRGLDVGVPRAVTTLGPLSALRGLQWLAFRGRAADGSLRPLTALTQLRRLEIDTSRFALEELAELAVALPRAEGEHHAPFRPSMYAERTLLRCKRCGAPFSHCALGKPSRMMCDSCDSALIARHVVRWEILVSAARARHGATATT